MSAQLHGHCGEGCPNYLLPLSNIQPSDGSKWTAAHGHALGIYPQWDKLWAKLAQAQKLTFNNMFLHDKFGNLPLRHRTPARGFSKIPKNV